MTNTLRIVLIVSILIYFVITFKLLKKKSLTLEYTLLWLLMGVIMTIFVIFPDLLAVIGRAAGIVDGMNALFTAAIGFCFCLLMALTSIASKQTDRIKRLIQANALLEKRVRELEKEQKKNEVKKDENRE